MARKYVVSIAIAASSVLATCASRKSEPLANEPSQGSTDERTEADTETSGTCDDMACVGTEDCCKGYSCGFDPGRSRVQRYCLAE